MCDLLRSCPACFTPPSLLACVCARARVGWAAHSASGPHNNPEWQPAFERLRSRVLSDRVAGVALMRTLRQTWLDRPHTIGRCARFYEHASQQMVAQVCVCSPPPRSGPSVCLAPFPPPPRSPLPL
jgi:hypothetical protein